MNVAPRAFRIAARHWSAGGAAMLAKLPDDGVHRARVEKLGQTFPQAAEGGAERRVSR
jgi:hypothetical protein